MNIVLVGYRCCGKTSVGRILAKKLGRFFMDTDEMIEEQTGKRIDAIIQGRGWPHFRKMERAMIRELTRRDNLVIATGGGVVMDEKNVNDLKGNGWLVWLQGRAEVLRGRMSLEQRRGNTRPSLTGPPPEEEIEEVLKERMPFYQKAADLMVDTSVLSPGEVAECITKAVQDRLQG